MDLVGVFDFLFNLRMFFGLEIGKAEEGMERSAMDDDAFPISPRIRLFLGGLFTRFLKTDY